MKTKFTLAAVAFAVAFLMSGCAVFSVSTMRHGVPGGEITDTSYGFQLFSFPMNHRSYPGPGALQSVQRIDTSVPQGRQVTASPTQVRPTAYYEPSYDYGYATFDVPPVTGYRVVPQASYSNFDYVYARNVPNTHVQPRYGHPPQTVPPQAHHGRTTYVVYRQGRPYVYRSWVTAPQGWNHWQTQPSYRPSQPTPPRRAPPTPPTTEPGRHPRF